MASTVAQHTVMAFEVLFVLSSRNAAGNNGGNDVKNEKKKNYKTSTSGAESIAVACIL